MDKMIKGIKSTYLWGKRFLQNETIVKGAELSRLELDKRGSRTEIINKLLSNKPNNVYLEIGVRRPEDNFNQIIADKKYSVDPGIEYDLNPVDFKVTSDDFFNGLRDGDYLSSSIKFDVIFIDGLHLAEQVYRDIENSLEFLKEDGFVVLHDCNPPTEWHAREDYYFDLTPARNYWNGTTWKAFYKVRKEKKYNTVCVDSDWGIGIITKNKIFPNLDLKVDNEFYEFNVLMKHRTEMLNLITMEQFERSLIDFQKK